MKTRAEIIQLLGTFKPRAVNHYGLTRIGIFGSVARGQHTENSDVDVCYEGAPLSLLTIDHMQQELQHLLGCNVDLVRMRDNMNALLKQRIQKEAYYV